MNQNELFFSDLQYHDLLLFVGAALNFVTEMNSYKQQYLNIDIVKHSKKFKYFYQYQILNTLKDELGQPMI